MQLTIYHNLIGKRLNVLNQDMQVVGIEFINNEPHVCVHKELVRCKPTPFMNRDYVVSAIYTIEQFEKLI